MPSFDPVKYFSQESSKYAKLLRGIFQCTSPEALKRIEPMVSRKYLRKVVEAASVKLRAADVSTGVEQQTRVVCFEKKPKSRDLWLDLQAQVKLDNDPERLQWLRSLLKFMEERGTPITKSPSVPDDSGRALDLYALFNLTMIQAGGMRRCTDNEGWRDIAWRMEFPTEKSHVLPPLYNKLLLPFEEHQKQLAMTGNPHGKRDWDQTQGQSSVKLGKRKIIFEENGNEAAGAVKDLRAHLNCRQAPKQPRCSVFNRLGSGGQAKRSSKKKRGKKRGSGINRQQIV